MKLCDFSLLSSELVQFSCDDLDADWRIGEAVSVQAHGNDYLLRQGDFVCVGKVVEAKIELRYGCSVA
jgi:hypothetical protein